MRILDAARRLFSEKGVEDTTIEDLADQADVARATFFNYFPTKAAVVTDLLHEQDSGFYRRLAAELDKGLPSGALLEGFFTGSAKVIEAEPDYYRVMIAESLKMGLGENNRHAAMVTHFKKIADAGVARGEVRTDYPADLLAEILVGAYTTVLRSWQGQPGYRLAERMGRTAAIMADFLAAPHTDGAHR